MICTPITGHICTLRMIYLLWIYTFFIKNVIEEGLVMDHVNLLHTWSPSSYFYTIITNES